MAITKPMLPPKKGYVEVEVDGKRTYRNVETGILIDDETEPIITAPHNIVVGEYVAVNGVLYMATQNIPNGEPIIVGQNTIETTIEAVLYELRGE